MRDVLDGLSLSKEVQDVIMAEYGKNIASIKNNNDTLKQENADLKKKVEEMPDVDQIKKEQFDLGKAEGTKELEDYKKSVALRKALKDTKVKDVDLLSAKISLDKLKYEEKNGDYEISGLSEQVEEIKKTHGYLFEEEEKPENSEQNQRVTTGSEHESKPTNTNTGGLLGALKEKYKK